MYVALFTCKVFMEILSTDKKNQVLDSMIRILKERRSQIIEANKVDLDNDNPSDRAMYDRLVVDDKKVDGMIQAVRDIRSDEDPIGLVKYELESSDGLRIVNKTAPFGTVLIIYESRPDVTIEAAVVAFKTNNRILLKGGKEAATSNKILVGCWHDALADNDLGKEWIELLQFNREQTQEFLRSPSEKLDLIVPRGGDGLIQFVKKYATCPVLVSGRGNNFIYVHKDADWSKAVPIILNAKTDKISACNALDKVLFDKRTDHLSQLVDEVVETLKRAKVEVILDRKLEVASGLSGEGNDLSDEQWEEEYLDMKIALGLCEDESDAIEAINRYSGGHSNAIITENKEVADKFLREIDAGAVYHNASTRFTDGGQFGIGAELAISTDKLHHRGPLGLPHLVTNKWYVYGDGQIRK